MTDVHCHVASGESGVREFLIGRDFVGIHPWETLEKDETLLHSTLNALRSSLAANAALGVGEIGLDRLKEKTISPLMREVFESQLELAFEFNRPVVLHGAKCWGQVVAAVDSSIRQFANSPIPAFLFHGFSRSDGLIPDIVKLNGYISVGPAVLNDHAVNYRELVKKIPLDRLVVETDRVPAVTSPRGADTPSIRDILAKTAEIRSLPVDELEAITDANATRMMGVGLGT